MTDEQTAAAIVAAFNSSKPMPTMQELIVRALQQARKAPAGHIIDDQGVVRRVLGTFKLTDDGCVIGSSFAAVWCLHAKTNKAYQTTLYAAGHFRKMWSTREAAEAAKEAKK